MTLNVESFWAKVDQSAGPDGCWPWQGYRTKGYGRVSIGHRNRYAHRTALALALGRELEPGMRACHACDNPPCCNPAHLFEGTEADNHADMSAKDRGIRGALDGEVVAVVRDRSKSPTTLARALGVSVRTVYRARKPEYRTKRTA